MNPLIMHINYCELASGSYGKRTIDFVCKTAAEIGFDGVEFRGVPPKELSNLSFKEYASQIAAGKKKYGLSDILFRINLREAANPDAAVRAKDIADAVENAKIARELCGSEVFNTTCSEIRSQIPTVALRSYEFHGSAAATEEQWKLTVDSYQQVGKELEKIGVRFAFETHMLYIHDTPEQVVKLINLIDSPAIGINMDYGNTSYFPVKPSVEETIDMYGSKLFYTHFKNTSATPGSTLRTPMPLSDGEINHRIYLEKLREVGFSGPMGIEAPRNGDRIHFAKQDYAYIRSVIESI